MYFERIIKNTNKPITWLIYTFQWRSVEKINNLECKNEFTGLWITCSEPIKTLIWENIHKQRKPMEKNSEWDLNCAIFPMQNHIHIEHENVDLMKWSMIFFRNIATMCFDTLNSFWCIFSIFKVGSFRSNFKLFHSYGCIVIMDDLVPSWLANRTIGDGSSDPTNYTSFPHRLWICHTEYE